MRGNREIFQAAAAREDPGISVRATELHTGSQWGKATWRLGRGIRILLFGRKMYYERALIMNLIKTREDLAWKFGLRLWPCPLSSRIAESETGPRDVFMVSKWPAWIKVMGVMNESSCCTLPAFFLLNNRAQ